MSNCVRLINTLIATAPLDMNFVEEFNNAPVKAKYDGTDSWITIFKIDRGEIQLHKKTMHFHMAFTTNREMRYYLEGIIKIPGAKQVPFWYQAEEDRYKEKRLWSSKQPR